MIGFVTKMNAFVVKAYLETLMTFSAIKKASGEEAQKEVVVKRDLLTAQSGCL